MGIVETLALSMGGAWASGVNLYGTVVVLGMMDNLGFIDLPSDLQILASWWVLAIAIFLYLIEFVADKIPVVDSLWDALHTFIRIPAGALLAAGAVSGLDVGLGEEAQTMISLLVGGTIAAGSHFTKAGSRAAINTSPEPVTNSLASVTEDVAVFGALYTVVFHPAIFFVLFAVFVLLLIWLVPKIWRFIGEVFGNARHPAAAYGQASAHYSGASGNQLGKIDLSGAGKNTQLPKSDPKLPPR
ncbi:membrane protein [Thalassospira profundimaris]|uniref:Membrane protein n=1 Tax=Thalassospira profundimaris TaxID=502049 RepID=A0A367W5T8_9PROT|nr:membrane protein [Thalassospira profundimaris]